MSGAARAATRGARRAAAAIVLCAAVAPGCAPREQLSGGGSAVAAAEVHPAVPAPATAPAPEPAPPAADTAAAVAALAEYRALCDAEGARLWGASLCGPLVLVHAPTRLAVANAPDPAGLFTPRDGAWVGALPAGVQTANTGFDWAGMRWAMVLLPLPADAWARVSLLAHESFHRVQPLLGLAAPDHASPHLDERDGRVWLRLEVRALAAALRALDGGDSASARAHATDALRLRAERHGRYPGADTLEAALERQEGLAEYTGVRVAIDHVGGGPARVAALLDRFEGRASYVRALGYATGPALGLLLDAFAPGWRGAGTVVSGGHGVPHDLGAALAAALGTGAGRAGATEDAPAGARHGSVSTHAPDIATIAARYGHAEIAAAEDARAAERATRLARYTSLLVDGPVLLLRHEETMRSFDPTTLVPLGTHGTVYPTATFQAPWGRLEVTAGGALLAPDFVSVRVSAAGASAQALAEAAAALAPPGGEPRRVHGDGWLLELAAGWSIRAAGVGGYVVTARGTPPGTSATPPAR